ncbi:serine protease inhibitor Kazal-type 4-like [Anthonomus grandis grandis]|uniref:serine protease inhibitor Kazal-type 4-like n=1 Tax=Anthonomus grandis grandis TaxID=2921223 RepID=UPI0021669D5C|nr:serine protease inhibitor Kazal-type 4-like [Anthonomus grandis grandis]
MKLYVVLLVVLVTLLSVVYGAPSKGSTKASLKKKQSCVKDCGDTYKPICAGDGSKNISFGSECVLANYNCENQKDLRLVSQGECPGGGGVRLS